MIYTHDDFLDAIQAEPADRTRRLVYADWLDERDDPRGELVRIEEEMRDTPVFADRFWELKPRRNALRRLIGAEWCNRMQYGTECEPVLAHGIPEGWRERWRIIREFVERWHKIPMPDVGGHKAEIARIETRLKRTLPPAMREWIAFCHDQKVLMELVGAESDDTRQPPANRDEIVLFPPSDNADVFSVYEVQDIGRQSLDAVSFLVGEGSLVWGVPTSELQNADPLVATYRNEFHYDDYALELAEDLPELPLTEFVLAYCLERTHGNYQYSTTGVYRDPTAIQTELRQLFPAPRQFGPLTIYERTNCLVIESIWNVNATHFQLIAAKPIAEAEYPPALWPSAPVNHDPDEIPF
jgi:uncharacterized protein (TIGR02996 family)